MNTGFEGTQESICVLNNSKYKYLSNKIVCHYATPIN